MLGRSLALLAAVVAAQSKSEFVCEGCQPPEAYINPIDRQIALTGEAVGNRVAPCTILKKQESVDGVLHQEVEWLPTEKCVKMDPPKHWRGLWRNEFEGSQFCPDVPTSCTLDDHPRIWFSWKGKLPAGAKVRTNGTYRVEFVGRMTSYQGSYGHMGVFDEEVIADRIISMEEIEAPPKE